MFETLAAPIINSILGQYIENIETNNLSVGVWSGDVKLQNVKLTKAALNRFQIPVEILEGYLGTLVLSIPWSDIKNKPVKIQINGLYLLAGPRHQTEFDFKAHQDYEFKIKMDKLNAVAQGPENDQNSTFMTQLIKRIVNNLQISISNIHIRLEDSITATRPFSVGLTIQELSAFSANEEWKEAFISGDMKIVHKILKLLSCSVYWNTDAVSFLGKSQAEFMNSMSSTILTESGGPVSWQYIVRPINGMGKVVIAEVPEHGQAKYNTDLEFEDFSFSIDEEQYSSLFALLEALDLSLKATPYRVLRPPLSCSPKAEPRLWFQFAAKCVLADIHERRLKWTWSFFKERRDDRRIYIDSYIKIKSGNESPSDLVALQQLERKLAYSDLKLYRAIADNKMKRESIMKIEKETASRESILPGSPISWSSWIFGASSAPTEQNMNQAQLKELYETIEFNPENVFEDIVQSPDDLLVHISWKLKNGSITLKKNPRSTRDILVSMLYDGLSATLVQRPESWFFVIDLMNLSLLDRSTPGTVYPRVISKSDQIERDGQAFFSFSAEINPLDQRADNAIKLKILPLDIIVNPEMLEKIISFFTLPSSETFSFYTIQAYAQEKISSIAQQTKAGLNYAIEKHKTLELVVDISAPIFIFPESCFEEDSWILFVNAGHLSMASQSLSKADKQAVLLKADSGTDFLLEAQSLLYDRYNLELTSTQVIVDRTIKLCRERAHSDQSDKTFHFLENLNVSFLIETSILPSLTEFPKFKITGDIKRLHMNLVDQKSIVIRRIISRVFQVFDSANSPEISYISPPAIDKPEISFPVEVINDSDSFGTDEFEDAREFLESTGSSPKKIIPNCLQVTSLFTFYIAEASITLISEINGTETDILSEVIILDVSLESVLRLYDSCFDCKVSNIQLANGVSTSDFIISKKKVSENDSALMSLNYRTFLKNSPDFTGDDTVLSLEVESLKFKLSAEPILKLYGYLLEIFKYSNDNVALDSTLGIPSSQTASSSRMNFILNDMMIKFVDDTCFASANFDTMCLSVQTSSQVQRIEGKIGKFIVNDLAALDSHYSTFLKVEADKLIDFSLLSETCLSGGFDTSFSMIAASIRIFYNPNFNSRFFSYLAKFQEMYSIMENARNSAIESAAAIKNQSDRFSYTIECQSPIIILPGQLLSTNLASHSLWLYLYPGRMVLRNALDSDDMFISFYEVKVSSADLGSIISQKNIVEQFNFSVRLYSETNANGRANCISVQIDDLKLIVDQQQYDLLVELYQFITTSSSSQDTGVSAVAHAELPNKSISQLPIYVTDSFKLYFKDISLCAVEGSSGRRFLFEILLANTIIEYSYFSDTSSSAAISIKVANFYNRLSSRLFFQEVISHNNGDNNQILITYAAPRFGSAKYVIHSHHMIVLLEVDFMYRVTDFFSKPWISQNVTVDMPISPYVTTYEFHIHDSEMLLLDTVEKANSEALILSSQKISLVMNAITTIKFVSMTLLLTRMDLRESLSVKLIDSLNSVITIDTQVLSKDAYSTNINLDLDPLAATLAFSDLPMVYGILYKNLISATVPNDASKPLNVNKPAISEKLRCNLGLIRVMLIDDLGPLHMPMVDISFNQLEIDLSNWSSSLKMDSVICLGANYFNLQNSHWEPLVESCSFLLNYEVKSGSKAKSLSLYSAQKVELVITHAFLKYFSKVYSDLQKGNLRDLRARGGDHLPYIIRNETGYPIYIWADMKGDKTDTQVYRMESGCSKPWKFEDWNISNCDKSFLSQDHKISIQLDGPSWESVKSVSVSKVGKYSFKLLPHINKVVHILTCSVTLDDKVKIVTLRSPNQILNSTSICIEAMAVNEGGSKVGHIFEIEKDGTISIPVGSAYFNFIRIRPKGFEYNWSAPIGWRQLDKDRSILVVCDSSLPSGASFNFQVAAELDGVLPKGVLYPMLSMRIKAPLQIENLLPVDIKYLVYDKVLKQSYIETLKSGYVESLNLVDPTHLLGLSLQIIGQRFKQSDVALISYSDLELRDEKISIMDADGRQLILGIDYNDECIDCGLKISIFCPYVILNRTGLDLHLRSKSLLDTSVIGKVRKVVNPLEEIIEPYLFSYPKVDSMRNRIQISVDERKSWCKPISLDAVGTSLDLSLPFEKNSATVHLGVKIQEGEGKYFMSKIVTLYPRIVLLSKLQEDISYRLKDSTNYLSLKAGGRQNLTHFSESEEGSHELSLKLTSCEWSKPFIVEEIGRIYIKCCRTGEAADELIRADIILEGATFYVTLQRQMGKWPYMIENASNENIAVWQKSNRPRTYLVRQHETIKYAWDDPSSRKKLLVLNIGGEERQIDLLQIGTRDPMFAYTAQKEPAHFGIQVLADGPVIILRITYLGSAENGRKKHESSESRVRRTASNETKKSNDSVVPEDSKIVLFDINIRIEGIGVSVINQKVEEILYFSAREVEYNFCDSNRDLLHSLGITWIQVDNQLSQTLEPIFIFPTLVPKEDKDMHPVFLASMCQTYGVDYYQWVTLLLQEISISFDEDFLIEMTEFRKSLDIHASNRANYLISNESFGEGPQVLEDDTILYFDRLLLHPFQFNISFSRTRLTRKSSDARAFLADVFMMTIGNIHDAPIRLNALELQHANGPFKQLANLIFTFYSQEAVGQLHKVIGSADVLGNPVKLFSTVSSGVSDMFYEPLLGFQISRPQDFGLNFVKGTGSLFKKTVFGVSDTLAKFTGSLGKGLSVATMDEKFQTNRLRRNRPRHAISGVADGAANLAKSITSGVTGIFTKPIEGAKSEGLGGFFKGLGKGVVGVVTKPVVGVFDLASSVTEGIKNTATVFDKELERVRLPRHIGFDKIVRVYSSHEAFGLEYLQRLGKGKYRLEKYIAHLQLDPLDKPGSRNSIILLSTSKLFLFYPRNLEIEWIISAEGIQLTSKLLDIRKISMENDKIIISKGIPNGSITNMIIDCSKSTGAKAFFSCIIKHLM